MTENLRYISTKPDAEFKLGEAYAVLIGVHQGFYELRVAGGLPHKYASLEMLLKFWQPASASWVERDPNGQALADEGAALS